MTKHRLFEIVFLGIVSFGIGLYLAGCNSLIDALSDNSDNSDTCTDAPLDCDEVKPIEGNLFIQATINQKNPKVPIAVFRGDFENNDLVLRDTLTIPSVNYTLPIIDMKYSVTALYIRNNGDTVLVIDDDDIEAVKDSYCDGDCYTVDDGHIDLILRFPKQSTIRTR